MKIGSCLVLSLENLLHVFNKYHNIQERRIYCLSVPNKLACVCMLAAYRKVVIFTFEHYILNAVSSVT